MRLPYRSAGTSAGRPVVLLHAWVESGLSFEPLMALLPQSWHLIAPDLRGHGAAATASSYSLADCAADVIELLDALGAPTAMLVGSSSGGYVAQQVAVSAPARVEALALVGAPRSLAHRPAFAAEVDHLTDPVDEQWVRDLLTWFPTYRPIPAHYLEARVAEAARLPARVWRDSLAGLITAVPPTELGPITAPTLIVRGARDEVLPAAEHEALAAAIPGAQLVTYPDVGHLVLWEAPDLLAADLRTFAR